ncbi:MAG: response regulator [Candidatus Sericytochromatia bacterium]
MSENLKVLVVDDDKSNLLIISTQLKKQNYEVFKAEHVIQALEIIKTNNIDVVITDIEMPYVNGIDFIMWLSKYKPEIQVIVMTGYGFDELKEFSTGTGVLKYFEKPIDIEKIISAIKESITKKGISAKISKVKIFDFVQLIIFSGKDKVVSVYDSKSETGGNIYIKNRKVIDAEIRDIKGIDAFYEIVKIRDGYFSEYDLFKDREITITKPTTMIMLKAAEVLQQIALEDIEYKKDMNVVIIEDNPIDTMILQKYLTDRNFNVLSTASGEVALELMKKEKGNYLAIIDIDSVALDGFNLMKKLIEEKLAKEVFLITAFSSEDTRNKAYNSGATGFFTKPIDIKELEPVIAVNFGNKGGLSGIVKGISITDFLQLEQASKSNKVINVIDNYSSKEGKMYISASKILHAEFDGNSGINAFSKILQVKNGSFIQKEWEDPKEISIDQNIQNLLMDSVKVIDEHNSELINLSPDLLNKIFLMSYSERENFILNHIIKPKTYISENYKKMEKIILSDLMDQFDFKGLLSIALVDIEEEHVISVKTKSFISEDELVNQDFKIVQWIAKRFNDNLVKEITVKLDSMTQIIHPIKGNKNCYSIVIFNNDETSDDLESINKNITKLTNSIIFRT